MFLINNLIIFLWWAVIMWLFFHDVTILICIAAVLTSAAPFYLWIATEPPGSDAPPMTCMSRYATLSSMTALSMAKSSIYGGKTKPKSFNRVIEREGGS